MRQRFLHNIRPIALFCLGLILVSPGTPIKGQTLPEPQREQLLNGLTVLYWQRAGDPNVLLKLRVHSGAAFDLVGKGGAMALLCDALFPDPITREYIAEDGGKLEVVTDYDSMTATILAKEGQFERMVELLRNALLSTQLGAETVAKLREARIKELREKHASAAEIADHAIAARLFGAYPYGHPADGAPETVAKVERPDLMLARDRFLNADNATLVVVGGMENRRAMRALRQLIGQWRKGDAVVPATFRQTEPVSSRVLVVNQNGGATAEIRLAARGLARADRDYAAAELLSRIVRDRWQAALPGASPLFVKHEAHTLPGMFLMGGSVSAPDASKAISAALDVLQSLVTTSPSAAELERARSQALAELSKQTSDPESVAIALLDIETYKLPPFNQQADAIGGVTQEREKEKLYHLAFNQQTDAIRGVTATDVQRVAARLFKGAQIARVAVGNSEELKASLGSTIELSGAPSAKTSPAPVTPGRKP
jgi:zinc protease